MNWKSGGGNGGGRGPWGGGGGTGGGMGGGRPSGNGGGSRRPSPTPPDPQELLRRMRQRIDEIFPGSGQGPVYTMLGVAAFALWLASGFYLVSPDEQGVVTRFGEYHRITQPGLNYHLPSPIETVVKPKVTRVQRLELGFRSGNGGSGFLGRDSAGAASLPEESLMLTGDENIVDINFEVQWKIRDAKDFLFNIRSPEMTVKNAAESAMREIIGFTPIATALAEGRLEIEMKAKDLLQSVLNSYDAGIEVVRVQMLKVDPPSEVIDAFRDVQTARADMERAINEAQTYSNGIIPVARGEAEKLVLDAEAYKARVTARAEGEASRFASVYKEYQQAADVTKKRIYIETMEEIMAGMNKVVVDDRLQGVVPFLPLNELAKPASSNQ